MRMTIGKKLIISFLVLAMLVLVSGVVGFFVLKESAESADTVAEEKAPIQYAVMNAALAVERVQKFVTQYTSSSTGLESLADEINSSLDEYDMWIAMIQYGTVSREFKDSTHGIKYKEKNLKNVVRKGTNEMLVSLESALQERDTLRQAVVELMESHKRSESYSVRVGEKFYPLPDFLNLAQIVHLDWLRQLKDAVNIETTFTGNIDPQKGMIGEWLNSSYQAENEEFAAIRKKFKKQYEKLLSLAEKINAKETYKDKLRLFNRGIGVTSKIEKYFAEMQSFSAETYDKIDAEEVSRGIAMTASAKTINGQLDVLIEKAAMEMTGALAASERVKNRGTMLLAGITLAAVVIAIIMGTMISRYLARRVGDLVDATRKIADGDLQKTIDVTSTDELGILAKDTNSMITNLRSMISQILSFSSNLTQSSQALAGISDDLKGNANDLSNKANAANGATVTMSTSMQEIATTANDSMERVLNVTQATEEMSSTISEIAQNTEQARTVTSKAVTTVEKTTIKMNELSEAAREIGLVADVIVAIADQTNLLSLNATIEAARAGEAGKGFAVVANEVKELAAQTNKATEDIRNKISAIQKSSDMTIAEISEIATVINDINAIVVIIAGAVEEQAATTQQIAEDIGSVSSGIEDMNTIVDSASHITESVSSDISAVNSTSGHVQTGSAQIGENAMELAKLSDGLQVLVGKFRL